jgi:hypothetical protein
VSKNARDSPNGSEDPREEVNVRVVSSENNIGEIVERR